MGERLGAAAGGGGGGEDAWGWELVTCFVFVQGGGSVRGQILSIGA